MKCTMHLLLTLSRVAKLLTHHSSLTISPGIITHSAPHIVHADLNSAFICNIASGKSQLAIYTRS